MAVLWLLAHKIVWYQFKEASRGLIYSMWVGNVLSKSARVLAVTGMTYHKCQDVFPLGTYPCWQPELKLGTPWTYFLHFAWQKPFGWGEDLSVCLPSFGPQRTCFDSCNNWKAKSRKEKQIGWGGGQKHTVKLLINLWSFPFKMSGPLFWGR